jgi:hypothetical protein
MYQETEDRNQKSAGDAGVQSQVTGVNQGDDMRLGIETDGGPGHGIVKTGGDQDQVTGVLERRRDHHHEEGDHGDRLLRTRVEKEAR